MKTLINWLLLAFFWVHPVLGAHELPSDVKLLTLALVSDRQLILMMHVPMAAVMREVDWPMNGPYLDMSKSDAALRQAAQLWLVDPLQARSDDRPLPPGRLTHVRLSLPSDTHFKSFEGAQQLLTESDPLTDRDLVPAQQMMDLRLVIDLPQEPSEIGLHFHADRLGLRVWHELRVQWVNQDERLMVLTGDPGWVTLNPGFWTSWNNFMTLGVQHILGGWDHLLFLAGLLLGAARLGSLIWTLSGFTAAHSITLAASALSWIPDRLWLAPAVEWLIALSVLWVSLSVAIWPDVTGRIRWAMVLGLEIGRAHV